MEGVSKQHVVDSLEDSVWPDPHPLCELKRGHGVLVNDVSRMSSFKGTSIDKIFFPRTEKDVVRVLSDALRTGRPVCMRGTKHSMGGQTIAPSGHMLDMKCMNAMRYDEKTDTVTCGPGCLWSDLIVFLNPFGKSPRTMQSYCTFSVGGSLSVNAHGITTDYCFAESVASFRIAHINDTGDAIITTVCKPGDDLFSCALGGYGLFGVITKVTLKIADNTALELDTLNVKVEGGEFLHYYNSIRAVGSQTGGQTYVPSTEGEEQESFVDSPGTEEEGDDDEEEEEEPREANVVIKLARLNILDCSTVQLFVYRRAHASNTVTGTLGLHATEMSMKTRILYKWLMPVMREARFAFEASSGQAIDMPDIDGLTRNEALFESAVPLAKLYEPLFRSDDTFILHEFFVPNEQFEHWIELAKPIYKELADSHSTYASTHRIILLNTTIRYVEQDKFTLLAYARNPTGNFAFVLYYRLPRTSEAEKALGDLHNRFAVITLAVGGTFYLPYRRCYSKGLLERAYPQIQEFAERKRKYDPVGMFTNLWYDQYVAPYILAKEPDYGRRFRKLTLGSPAATVVAVPGVTAMEKGYSLAQVRYTDHTQLPRASLASLVTRRNSYRRLLNNSALRRQFKDQFLTLIFSFADNVEVIQTMAKHAWDPRNKDDFDIYCCVREHFHGPESDQDQVQGQGQGQGRPLRDSSARVRYSDRDGGGGNGVMGHWSDVDSWAGTDAKGISEDDDCDADAGYGSGSGEKQGGSGRGGGAGPMAKAMQMVRSIKQLHNQKMELTRETVAILSRLGKRKGDLHDYASFGDNGKLVSKLRYTLEMKGKAWICHDMECDDDNIAGVLERGSLDPVGTYVPFDYMAGLSRHTTAAEVCLGAAQESNKGAWLMDVQKSISDESVDLVTINQGLHHIPPPRLLPFLQEVRRILRPGGVFIFREHDVNLDRGSKQTHGCPVEMVDLAHSVFNAVTGASSADEKREIRAFRPLQEWRDIVSSVGLADAMMQGMESGDCTCDEMLCFVKPPMNPSQSPLSLPPPPPPQEAKGHPRKKAKEEEFPDAPPLVGLIKTLLAQVPAASASSGGALVHSLTQLLGYMLPTVRAMLLTHMPQALKEEFPNAIDITSKLEPTVTANLKVVLSALEMLEEMIDRMEVNTEVDVPILYPEFFLVLPVIDRKVRERPEKASEVEVKLVEFLRSYLPALLVTASSSSSSSSSASDASISEGSATRDDGAPSDEAEEDGMSVEERENVVTGEEVLATLRQMETSLPDLLSPSTLAQSGFNVRQQGALAGKFGGRDMESTAKILASYLDRSSWNDAKEALLEAAALGLRPTKQRMLDVSSGGGAAPWHRATRAFLASPHVALTSAGKFGLSLIGLNEFLSLYDVVKQEVKERAAALDAPVGEVSRGPLVAIGDKDMKRGDREKVSDGIRALCSTGTILTRRFQFKDKEKDGSGVTILHVGKILRATYGYTSLTSRPTNITQGLRRHHEACVRESSVGTGDVGTLVVTEELCERLRNPGAAGGTLDHIRKGVVQVATFGQAGKSALTLTYRVVDDRKDKDEGRGKDKGKGGARDTPRDSTATREGRVNANVDKAVIAGMLSSALRNSGVTRNLHVDSGAEYTWFKLCEWMQVEIMDLQVRSLDHTPWYRFPYLEILSVYFATLKDECAFVARKHGLRAAYGSMAFLTDVIPGIVMAFMYGQLKLLAAPLLAAVDTEGYEDTHSVFLEEIVMFMHLDIEKTKAEEGAPGLLNRRSREDRIGAYFRSIDPNIKEVTAVGGLTGDTETGLSSGEADGAMVVVVSVPPFKPFSDLLLSIATFIPSAQILEISNQTELQVRVSCEEKHQEEATAWLVREFDESEVEIVTRYQFPISPDQARVPGRVQLALKVAVTQLLVLFRACGDSAQVGPRVLRVEQSYDCWNDTIREG